jgi:hypothetical protein
MHGPQQDVLRRSRLRSERRYRPRGVDQARAVWADAPAKKPGANAPGEFKFLGFLRTPVAAAASLLRSRCLRDR